MDGKAALKKTGKETITMTISKTNQIKWGFPAARTAWTVESPGRRNSQ